MPTNHDKPLCEKRVMWGKYAGRLFSDIPTEYLEWFVKNAYPQMKNRKQWAMEELERRKNVEMVDIWQNIVGEERNS